MLVHASARAALREGSDPGVTTLHHELTELAACSGLELAEASAARAARHIAAHLLQQLDLEQAAFLAPLEEMGREIEREAGRGVSGGARRIRAVVRRARRTGEAAVEQQLETLNRQREAVLKALALPTERVGAATA